MSEQPGEKRMRLRYAGTCRVCGAALDARTEAVYERATKTVRCLACSPSADAAGAPSAERAPQVGSGTAGVSARREYERRRAKREERVRTRHPRLGGLILALSDDPQSTAAWDKGALGEERLGQRLDELASETLRLLHDRRIPGTRANIDHLAVTPTGVWVIDAKRYVAKRPTLRVEGGILRARVERLMVGSSDRTKLVDGVLKQVDLVRSLIDDAMPVAGVLCFVDADWPLVGGTFATRGVDVLWPRKLYPRLSVEGSHAAAVAETHARLAGALPQA